MAACEEQPESPTTGVGCALFVLGPIGAAFGIAALVGVSGRIELESFEIGLNEPFGRLLWIAGCLVLSAIG